MSDPRELPAGVAVVGLACRFPGAADYRRFWEALRAGRESITRLADDEVDVSEVGVEALADPAFVKVAPMIEGVELFDPEHFGMTQREAEITDPQHRLFLETAWEALEDCGHDPARFAGAIGVFAGAGSNSYARLNLLSNRDLVRAVGGLQVSIGNDKDHLAPRASYKLDLRGPSLNVQTACSTSLVAVHLACQSLLGLECDLALAGGVSVSVPQRAGYFYTPDGIGSPDGHCRAFDDRAQGTVFGDGVGVVALRRLADAVADGDHVWAVIRGTAVNNDGAAKVGYTAPAVDGQAGVVAEALAVAGVEPESLGYVEAHGTGTPLGDPIEVAALTEVFRESTARRGFCGLGSVKTNVGHLDTAAGAAGLIKTVLALHHGEIPPTLHFERPNRRIDFDSSPFYVVARPTPWPANGTPRRAGVSSFGIGGTNAHAVVEEAPPAPPPSPSRPRQLLAVSARTAAARDAAAGRLAGHLAERPDLPLADVAFTLLAGRRRFRHRGIAVAAGAAGAAAALAGDDCRLLTGEAPETPPGVAFLFPGQGSQHPGMARELYDAEPAFRAELDRCARLLEPRLGRDLRPAIFAGGAAAAAALEQTDLAQPAIFAVDYALARLWSSWGIEPQAMLGHSLGELVAACLAGVFELEAALGLVAERGRLMAALPGGAMLAVPLAAGEVTARLGTEEPGAVELAAVNGPALSVLSGPAAAIEALAGRLAGEGIDARRLRTSHAFHSAAMEPVLEPFARAVEAAGPRPPRRPFLSNLDGAPVDGERATDPGYWAGQLRRPVRFADGVARLLAGAAPPVLLEVGPGQALATLARRHPDAAGRPVIASLPRPGDAGSDHAAALTALGRLWLAGVDLDPAKLHAGERRRRVPLPTYPFERRRCWVDPAPVQRPAAAAGIVSGAPAAGGEAAETVAAAAASPAAVSPLRPRPPLGTRLTEPRDPEERAVVGIFEQLLGVGPLGAEDDFFELGGHSLLATQVVELIRRRLGAALPMRLLFSAPTAAGLAREARARRESGAEAAGELPTLTPDPAGAHLPFPLTEVQQAYWIGRGGDFELGNVATHLYLEVESDALDLARLATAWRRLIERHATLRTVVEPSGLQRVLAEVPRFEIPQSDLSALPAAAAERALAAVREEMSHQVRPADRWPLFEVRASRLPGGRVRVHLSYDFLLGDAWSWQVLFRDLAHFYHRPERPLPPLELTFRDYVLALEELRAGDGHRRALEYWRGRLATLPPGPALPLGRSPGEIERPRFTRRTAGLPAPEWARLKARAGRAGVTPSAVLAAAFADVLAQWSASPRFTLNLTLFNRLPLHPQVSEVIGDFTSLVLLEVDAAAAESFEGRARRLQERLWRDLEHRSVSGVQVMRELARARGVAAMPMPVVFTSTLHLDGGDGGDGAAGDGAAGDGAAADGAGGGEAIGRGERLVYSISQTPQVWLDHQAGERDGELSFNWDGVEEIFPPGLLDRMFAAYRARLERLAADDGAWREGWRSSALAVLGEDDLAGRRAANDTAGALPAGLLHQPFLARAAEQGDRPAVITAERTLDFAALDRLSARWARELRRRGAGPGRLVGVVMEKGWEQAVAALAVVRAGAAYLPVGADLPPARRALLLERGRVELALTQERLAGELEWPPGIAVLPVGAGDEPAAPDRNRDAGDEPLPAAPCRPGDLAYVIFTSGSTGEPKGVMIDHRGALNTLADVDRRFAIGPADRVLALSSLSFDLSVWDLFGIWAAGGAAVLPEPAAARDPERWSELAERFGVTVWSSVPALLAMQVESLEARGGRLPASLRLAMLSGDWIPVGLPDRVRALGGGVEVVSLGGATEASIWSIVHPIGAVDPAWRSVPYGRPMANQTFEVLDPGLAPRPEWVPGELYIGGAGLARGYWRDPVRTAESFVADPAGGGGRLYRTGDLGRWLPGGVIEFLGRDDDQVKIGGHRVELGEVEAALAGCPGVRAAVAAAIGEPRRLVVYAVPGEPGADLAESVRDHLSRRLPSYMVPAAVVALDALPLSANGKVDRRALPAPDAEAPAAGGFEPCASALEERLAELFAAAVGMGTGPVGRHDSFFALGGDSLLATRTVYRLREEFGIELPLGEFFAASTVAELAERIEEAILSEIETLPEESVRAELGEEAP